MLARDSKDAFHGSEVKYFNSIKREVKNAFQALSFTYPDSGAVYTRGQRGLKDSKSLMKVPCFNGLLNKRMVFRIHGLWK